MGDVESPEAHAVTSQDAQDEQPAQNSRPTGQTGTQNTEPAATMSKNARKRLRRTKAWEDGREDRKQRRRERRVATKARRRQERAELLAQGADPAVLFAKRPPAQLVPVSLILDCDFEEYMTDKERVSLSSQVTRCYSDNRSFKYRTHLWISGWGGKLKERFETALEKQHTHWKAVGFEEGDFLAAAAQARAAMKTQGGTMTDALRASPDGGLKWEADGRDPFPLSKPAPELDGEHNDVVYLTSESPYTLERLEPNTSYVIGGLVDKNREKGLCFTRAVEKGVRTAKLPIAQYMKLRTRRILATNHVVEIMLRWLECGDWAKAFMHVIPKRKGIEMVGEGNEDRLDHGDDHGDADNGEPEAEAEAEAELSATDQTLKVK
ncbi:tRNA (guanine(9)-N(1))-methyltransferase [Metarhizium rileyi]|uniref:tRNA (guanine(9)-N1)-methyltransferase n=1 Tax=Metarhizium rileyi (strain RCEF 4871) TaxID=1649241 RepID=A0A5C6GJN4_METRR|nr:tRNA (guanine(9)-N(1))-methyltransferase [Metarhizium rileyi]